MSRPTDREALAVGYLLGTLSEEERSNLEERFFSNDQDFDELEILEEELIDRYVRGELTDAEHDHFEKTLLTSPRLVERVQFARILAARIGSSSSAPILERSVAHEAQPRASLWRTFVGGSFEKRSAFRVALTLGALFVLLGGVVLLVGWLKLTQESQRLAAEEAALQQMQQELDKRRTEQQSENDQLASQLQNERLQREAQQKLIEKLQAQNRTEESTRQTSDSIATLFLLPGTTRSGGGGRQLTLTPKTSTIKLTLDLGASDYASYRASIRTPESREIFSKSGLRPQHGRSGNFLTLQLPSKSLEPGDYVVHIDGLTTAGATESANDYSFRAVEKH